MSRLTDCQAALKKAKADLAACQTTNANLKTKVADLQAQVDAQQPAPTPDPKPTPSGRLFPSSPFYVAVGANPALDPNSAGFVGNALAQGAWATGARGTELTKADWTRPYYEAKDSDPTVTVHGGLGGSWTDASCEGNVIHVPKGARPAAGQYWEDLDGGVVIRQPNGMVYSAWRSRDPVDGSAYQWAKIDGTKDGVPSGGMNGIGQAQLGPHQGTVTYDELVTAQEIPHALFMEVRNWHRRDWPGRAADGKDATIPRGGYSSDASAPPMGGHFWLSMSPAEINALSVPTWKKVILRAMATYGLYTYDNGGSAHSLDWESAIPTMGGNPNGPNRWVEWCKSVGIPGHFDGNAGKTIYSVDIQSGVDWTRLKVLKPLR